MSIVPFRLESVDASPRTVVLSDADFDPDGSAILLKNADRSLLTNPPNPPTYDLHVGPPYRDHH